MLPLVVQVEEIDAHKAHTCAFRKSPVRVGRNPLNDLVLEERYISQWHAVIRFDGERVTYLDLGSTNPTQIDGKPATRNVEVTILPDTVVQIGRVRLHFLRDEVEEDFFGSRRKSAFSDGAQAGLPASATTMYFPTSGATAASSGDKLGSELQAIVQSLEVKAPAVERAANKAHKKVAAKAPVKAPATPAVEAPSASRAATAEPAKPVGITASYESYRKAWSNLLEQVRQDLTACPASAREERVFALQERHPAVVKEPEFRALLLELGVDPLRSGEPELADWFRRLTGGLFPPLGAPVNQALALERVGAILETFADGFVAMRKSQEEFANGMALRLSDEEEGSMLQRAEESPAVLAYLLDPGKGGVAHLNELRRVLADFSLHHVGLVGAVVDGARAVLDEISPDRISGEQAVGRGLLGRLSRAAEARSWEAFVAVYDQLLDEDRFTRTLFGRAFARRYYQAVAGRRPSVVPPAP